MAGTSYDPGGAHVQKAVSSLLAMTAIDTTNLRLTFVAPRNGTVLVRMRTLTGGTAGSAMILLGVLEGSTVRGRQSPMGLSGSATGSNSQIREVAFLVTGLTAGTSYTYDAAYAVLVTNASAAIRYGGPNDTTGDNAHGSFDFSIWSTENLLAGTCYDPGSAASLSMATLIAMTAMDTTNLRLTFTAPPSGAVQVRMHCVGTGATGTKPQVLLGVLDGSTVKGRQRGSMHAMQLGAAAASDHFLNYASFLVTGLTPGTSYTYDAAYGVEVILASTNIRYGGPNGTTGNDAWGGFAYEIWAA